MWSDEWTSKWKRFVATKERDGHGDRVQWNKYEYRFFLETCEGRSLVTGQQVTDKEADIDRVFNDDGYRISNCILIDVRLNFAKRGMTEFTTSRDFHGGCKLTYGATILHQEVQKLLNQTPSCKQLLSGLRAAHKGQPLVPDEATTAIEFETDTLMQAISFR
ncbi:hypothetical protein BGZ68_007110 [Mortierella alpina]|nr:hypothetical protein BGZ68_007110 [Mortierella alpina]